MIAKAMSRPQPDPYLESWRRLCEAQGVGPSRLQAVLILDPECGDEECLYYDPHIGGCRLFKADIPWSRGSCRLRTHKRGEESDMAGSKRKVDRPALVRSRRRKLGVPAAELRDADLERELRHLWRTREETVLHGGPHAIRAHTDRMLELEHEYVARFPRETEPAPSRTRRGARMSGMQPIGRAGRRAARTRS